MLLLRANFMALFETHLITALTMVVMFYCCVVVGLGNISIYRQYREARSCIVVLQTFSQVNNIAYVVYCRVYKDTETNTVNNESLVWLKFGEFGEIAYFAKLCSFKA